MPKHETTQLIFCVAGVATCFFLSRHAKQVLLVDAQFGPQKGAFPPYTDFLRFTNAVTACIVALAAYAYSRKMVTRIAPLSSYVLIACCTTLAAVSDHEMGVSWGTGSRLTWGSAVVLAVMAWQQGVLGVKHEGRVWVVVIAFSLSCMLAAMSWALPGSRESDPVGSDPEDRWQEGARVMGPGWAVAVAYAVLHVGCDSVSPVYQDQIFRETTAGVPEQMLFISLCVGILNLAAFLFGGHLPFIVGFLLDHPAAIQNLCLASLPWAVGLFLMLWMLRLCGALVWVMLHLVLVVFMAGAEERVLDFPTSALWWIGLMGMIACLVCLLWSASSHHPHPLGSSSTEKEMEDVSLLRHKSGSSEDTLV